MERVLRFAELVERKIVTNWMTTKRWIDDPNVGFPPGRMMGPNTRVWFESEIESWLKSRPTEHPRKVERAEIAKARAPRGQGNARKCARAKEKRQRAQSEAKASA